MYLLFNKIHLFIIYQRQRAEFPFKGLVLLYRSRPPPTPFQRLVFLCCIVPDLHPCRPCTCVRPPTCPSARGCCTPCTLRRAACSARPVQCCPRTRRCTPPRPARCPRPPTATELRAWRRCPSFPTSTRQRPPRPCWTTRGPSPTCPGPGAFPS